LTDSYYWIVAEADLQSGDFTHPSQNGYGRIAAHLFYASKGLNLTSSHRHSESYTGDFGSVSVTYSKLGSSISFAVAGNLGEGFNGSVNIGAFIKWLNPTKEIVLPLFSDVPGSALQFWQSSMYIFMPAHTGIATISGCFTVNLDIF
jgi:hypothetical protein